MKSCCSELFIDCQADHKSMGLCVYIVFFARGTHATLALMKCLLPVVVDYSNVGDLHTIRMLY